MCSCCFLLYYYCFCVCSYCCCCLSPHCTKIGCHILQYYIYYMYINLYISRQLTLLPLSPSLWAVRILLSCSITKQSIKQKYTQKNINKSGLDIVVFVVVSLPLTISNWKGLPRLFLSLSVDLIPLLFVPLLYQATLYAKIDVYIVYVYISYIVLYIGAYNVCICI